MVEEQLDNFYTKNSRNSLRSQKSLEETAKGEEKMSDEDEYIPEEFTAIHRHKLVEEETQIKMAKINKLVKDKSRLNWSITKQFHSAPAVWEYE